MENISSAMNTIYTYFCIFRCSNTREALLALILYHSPSQLSIIALMYMYFILEVIILFNSWLCFND